MSKHSTVCLICTLWDIGSYIQPAVEVLARDSYGCSVIAVEGGIACLPGECSMHEDSVVHSDMMGKYAIDKMGKAACPPNRLMLL